jgi:hypothetical protein
MKLGKIIQNMMMKEPSWDLVKIPKEKVQRCMGTIKDCTWLKGEEKE